VTGGMEEDQGGRLVMLVVAIPVRQFAVLLALDHLSADGALAVLLPQDFGTKRRRRLLRQVPLTGLDVRLPVAIERIGLPLDLEMAWRFDRFPNPEKLLAGDRVRTSPRLSRSMRNVTRGDPVAGLVRVAPFGPPETSSPANAIERGAGLATDDVAMIIRPAAQAGVKPVEAPFRGDARRVLTEGFHLAFAGPTTGLARGDLEFGRVAMRPFVRAQSLP
jgi:hypothetical protein